MHGHKIVNQNHIHFISPTSITDNAVVDKGFVGGSGSYNYSGTGNIEYMSNKGLDIVYAFNDLPVKMTN